MKVKTEVRQESNEMSTDEMIMVGFYPTEYFII